MAAADHTYQNGYLQAKRAVLPCRAMSYAGRPRVPQETTHSPLTLTTSSVDPSKPPADVCPGFLEVLISCFEAPESSKSVRLLTADVTSFS